MTEIITAAAAKGGSGKTTTCAALAQAAVKGGLKVLAVDLDPQANLTMALGANQNEAGAYDLIRGAGDPRDTIQPTAQGVDVIAGGPDLATLKTTAGSANRLRDALQPIQGSYDLILIDTPPTVGEMQYNALEAATGLIIPIEADNFSLQGLYQIIDVAKQFQGTNDTLRILGTVLTRYDGRSKISQYYEEVISEKGAAEGAPVIGIIHQGVAVKEAAAFQVNLFEHAPKSRPAKDYIALYEQLKQSGLYQ